MCVFVKDGETQIRVSQVGFKDNCRDNVQIREIERKCGERERERVCVYACVKGGETKINRVCERERERERERARESEGWREREKEN